MTGAPGAVIGGRFRLDALVGQGDMGRVWRGHDLVLDRDIAVKEVLLPASPSAHEQADLVARTTRDARAAARLNHPGLVTIHDVIEHDGVPWIVMEYVPGMSLAAELANQGRLPWRWAAEIGDKIADALAHAHAAGIVHRDLKPDNVLLAGDRVVVTDCGIARVLDETGRLTGAAAMVGAPDYLAPEQLAGGQVDAAADIWSLGATLYRAIEGRPPFTGPTFGAVLAGVLARDPEPPVQAGPLAPLLTQMLAKDPRHRPDARAVARALGARHSQAADAEAPPVPALEPVVATAGPDLAARWRGRPRVLAACAAVVVVLIGAGTYYLVGGSPASGDARAGGQPSVSAKPLAAAQPSVSARSTAKPAPPPPVGDACLVGAWRDDSQLGYDTYNGTTVAVHTSGGDVDHIFATGVDEDTFGLGAAPSYGTYQGQTLEEIDYGELRSTIRATPRNHHLTLTGGGWSANSVVTFYYAGQKSIGYYNGSGQVFYRTYRCSAGTFTLLNDGKVIETETRISRTP
jgi:hypothetical protein